MSIPAPISVLGPYGLIDETDDALARPVVPAEPARLDTEDDAAFKARHDAWAKAKDAAEQEFARRYLTACETGKWSDLLVEGKVPTVFRVRQVGVTAWSAFLRVARRLGQEEIALLAFRLAVTEIENLNLPVQITRGPYVGDDGRRERAFGDVLSEEVVDAIALAEGGRGVVNRIGSLVLGQRGAPLGK